MHDPDAACVAETKAHVSSSGSRCKKGGRHGHRRRLDGGI